MTIEMIEDPEVATEVVDRAEIKDGNPVVAYTRTEAALADLRTRFADAKFDLTTTAGDKAARSARLELVTLRTTLEKTRKAFKAPALEFGKKIDSEAARITAAIEALESPIDAQIRADEKRRADEAAERARVEAERIAKHEAGIARIRAYLTHCQGHGMTAERINAGITQLAAAAFGPEWQEFAVPAASAQCETLNAMRALHASAQEREAEAARIEAQRIENERMAAELAAERQKLAQQAEQLKAAQAIADARAESERLEALAEANRKALAAAAPAPLPPEDCTDADPALPEVSEDEAWYDAEIAPALAALGKRCEDRGMAFVACVEYQPGGRAGTYSLQTAAGLEMRMLHLCAQTAPNVDRYVMVLRKLCEERGIEIGGSFVLRGLGA